MIEYIVKKDGYDAQICVGVIMQYGTLAPRYCIGDINIRQKGKRKWLSIRNEITSSYAYRATEYSQRGEYLKTKYKEYVTDADISNALEFAYSTLKPNENNIDFR